MTGASNGGSPGYDSPHAGVSEARPKVLYVMGAGHSGSTILGVALGNCTDIFYAGELEEWTLRSGVPFFGGSERTRFWVAVDERVEGAEDLFGSAAREALVRSSAALRIDRWSARRRLGRRYREVAESLYRAVAQTAESTTVVDTSHYPLRARELQGIEEIDLYLLFLVRDPHSVIKSYLAHINRYAVVERWLRILTKNADLWLTHVLSLLVFLRHPRDRRLFLRHEDFIADPQGVLRQILDRVGSAAELPDLASLQTGVPLMGNPLLWSDVVALNSKPASQAGGSPITTVSQLPWRAIFSRLRPAATAAPSTADEPISAPASR